MTCDEIFSYNIETSKSFSGSENIDNFKVVDNFLKPMDSTRIWTMSIEWDYFFDKVACYHHLPLAVEQCIR